MNSFFDPPRTAHYHRRRRRPVLLPVLEGSGSQADGSPEDDPSLVVFVFCLVNYCTSMYKIVCISHCISAFAFCFYLICPTIRSKLDDSQKSRE